jgi:hypothetical protein
LCAISVIQLHLGRAILKAKEDIYNEALKLTIYIKKATADIQMLEEVPYET